MTHRQRSGRVPGIAPQHPPTPPDIRFSASGGWTQRLNRVPQDRTASRIRNAAKCDSTRLFASSPAPRQTKRRRDASAHSAASTRVPPSTAMRGIDPAHRASAARSTSVYAAESSPPAKRSRADPRPAGNNPTSRRYTAAGPHGPGLREPFARSASRSSSFCSLVLQPFAPAALPAFSATMFC